LGASPGRLAPNRSLDLLNDLRRRSRASAALLFVHLRVCFESESVANNLHERAHTRTRTHNMERADWRMGQRRPPAACLCRALVVVGGVVGALATLAFAGHNKIYEWIK
jgi:hypothetical protein